MKKQNLADLHIHSLFSDGTMTPAEIFETAAQNGLSVFAVTDHNTLAGARALFSLPKKEGIRRVAGVELDGMALELNLHILAYGIDLDSEIMDRTAAECARRLEEVNVKLIQKLAAEIPSITVEDYLAFPDDHPEGGWKALYYFREKGLTQRIRGGFEIYGRYNHDYSCVEFLPVEELCRVIHLAGGKAVLAHPGKSIPGFLSEVMEKIGKLAEMGLDGIECRYPAHSPEMTEALVRFCRERDLLVTSGSDCHGTFEGIEIGGLGVRQSDLTLDGIRMEE